MGILFLNAIVFGLLFIFINDPFYGIDIKTIFGIFSLILLIAVNTFALIFLHLYKKLKDFKYIKN